jgi:hypothetical protein
VKRAILLAVPLACAAPLTAPGAALAAKRDRNPCLIPADRAKLRCPDLVMKRPFGLRVDRTTRRGRVLLRAGNSIDNVGTGPAELLGVRPRGSRLSMRGRQRIYRRGGGRLGRRTGARLYFKLVPGQGRYWKFLHAGEFAVWRLDAAGRRVKRVRRGPKVSYCLRDLAHSRPKRPRSPAHRVYPACDESASTRKVLLGTSVGWADVYPPSYPEQWIDVTGLRGCFAYRETADPRNGIYESNEANNASQRTVRLPYRAGRRSHCPRAR